VTLQQIMIAQIVEDHDILALQSYRAPIGFVSQVKAFQLIVACCQTEPSFGAFRISFHAGLKLLFG